MGVTLADNQQAIVCSHHQSGDALSCWHIMCSVALSLTCLGNRHVMYVIIYNLSQRQRSFTPKTGTQWRWWRGVTSPCSTCQSSL